jgi:hypothetical protein
MRYLMYAYRICISVIRCLKKNKKSNNNRYTEWELYEKVGFQFCLTLTLLLLYHMSVLWALFTSRTWKDEICPDPIGKNVTEGHF